MFADRGATEDALLILIRRPTHNKSSRSKNDSPSGIVIFVTFTKSYDRRDLDRRRYRAFPALNYAVPVS